MTNAAADPVSALVAATSLPNLHPAVVHFPIALLLTALGLDLACLLLRRQTWLDRAATTLYVLGALGAGAAFLSGDSAADSTIDLPGVVQAAMAEHERFALMTLVAAGVTAALRLLVSWLGRKGKRLEVGALRLVALTASLVTAGLIVVTADHGGALVFEHQVGTAAVQQRALDTEDLEP